MRIEFKIVSSITRGLNETYKNIEDLKQRIEYIEQHKDEFKNNSMLFVYEYLYNENDKIVNDKTLKIIDFKEMN